MMYSIFLPFIALISKRSCSVISVANLAFDSSRYVIGLGTSPRIIILLVFFSKLGVADRRALV